MIFADTALQLCGQCALLLGWRPDEFWDATPAELACVLNAVAAQSDVPPDASDLQALMELFRDAPSGGD
jgi:Phage tail assembly chaperone protein, TAC